MGILEDGCERTPNSLLLFSIMRVIQGIPMYPIIQYISHNTVYLFNSKYLYVVS
jgi:hypothetical protein